LRQKLICKSNQNEKALRETQTLRAGCSKEEPTISPRCRPPSQGARDGRNLISWRRSLPSPTDPVWWRSMHAISSYLQFRVIVVTDPQTNDARPPQTGPMTIHCAA